MADIRELAARIAANYATNANDSEEVVTVLRESYNQLRTMEGETQLDYRDRTAEGGKAKEPGMDPRKAIGHDTISCLVCGKAYKTLKRHLRNAHDMSPGDYRAAFDLAKDYPLIAPGLSEQRAKVAKEHNLGERLAEARKKQRQGGE